MNAQGALIIALERTCLFTGIVKRKEMGEEQLENIKYTTPWNQMEAAIAYTKGLPLMIIAEEGLRQEGILEGYDWYILKLKPENSSLASKEFNGVLSSWKKKVEAFHKSKFDDSPDKPKNLGEYTISDLVQLLKPAQLWGLLVALTSIIVGAFALGAKFFVK